jgi:uncharacterized protein (TIGR02996 family)
VARPLQMLMEQDRFIDALRHASDDEVLRLAYADWLEERSDLRSEYLRLHVALPKMTKRREYPALKARRDYLRSQIDTRWLVEIGDLAPGKPISGRVKRATEDAAYVDLGLFTGVIHAHDFSGGRRPNLTDFYTVGEEVEAVILAVSRRRRRIALTPRHRQVPSWQYIADAYWVGTVVAAEVINVYPEEWLIQLEPGVCGRLPRAGLPDEDDFAVERCMTSRERLPVRVTEIDFERGLISVAATGQTHGSSQVGLPSRPA